MRNIFMAGLFMFVGSIGFAQTRSRGASTPPPLTSTNYQSSGNSEVIGTLGFVNGAANFGAQYNRKSSDPFAYGGYFFMQTSKDKDGAKLVNQAMSFGGQLKASLLDTARINAYLSPGFGVHVIKDVADKKGGSSDVSALGPTLRIGVLIGLTPTVKAGLERFEYWNWLDDTASASYAFYSAAVAFEF